MKNYSVTYFYHATGMEFGPDVKDYGIVKAETADDAKDFIAAQEYPIDEPYAGDMTVRDFFKGCLTATEV